ncbi:Fc.00g058780.m01.CDS01 [Cosmosporella sp. VM-42]
MGKTWFLPPDFNFIPEGELKLGTVLKYPDRPTLALASLCSSETPAIPLPEVTTLTEKGHAHSGGSSRSAGVNLFAKILDLASASGRADISRSLDRSFGTVGHEVRSLAGALSPEALRSIIQLEAINKFINGGPFDRFRKRPIYLISGLRVAKDSFTVTNTTGSAKSAAADAEVSAVALGAPVPLEVRAGAYSGREKQQSHSYDTAPGIVFAYRLHVIRVKGGGDDAESELFSDTTAFFTGENEDEDEREMEFAKVDGEDLKNSAEVRSAIDESDVGDETLVVFKSS